MTRHLEHVLHRDTGGLPCHCWLLARITRYLGHVEDMSPTQECRSRTDSPGGLQITTNLIIEKARRLAHGFRTFEHYRIRILLAASGTRPYRRPPNHA